MADKLTELFVKVGADTRGLDKGLKGAEKSAQGFAGKFGKQMKIAGFAMVGLTAAISGASLKMAGDFDGAMREVNTMMLLGEDQFKAFSKEIQATARDLGVGATDSAKALYQAISAGIPKENVVTFLEIATKAAIGGVTDTITAVDGLTTVLNAFKIPVDKAQQVADVMFTTVKGGKTTFEELSASMFQVAPLAAAAGVKFEEISAGLATLTKQGVPTSVATTQLRAAIQATIKPTGEMKEALDSLGYASGDALIAEQGLAGALNLLTEAAGGSNELLGKMFGSVEGLQAVLSLTGEGAEVFAADLDAMANAAGAATDAFDQMEQSTSRKFQRMKAQLADMAITIGTALLPTLQKLMEIITPIVEKIAAWIEDHPKLTVALLAGVAVLGAMLIILPKIIALIGILKGITLVATIAQWALNVAMTANPIGLIIMGIAALVVGIIFLIRNFDKVKAAFKVVGDFIVARFREVVNFFNKMAAGIRAIFWKVVDFILAPIRFVVGKIIDAINWVIRMFNKLPGVNLKLIGGAIPAVSDVPNLGKGAIVTGPTLAMIGERGPEAIVPLAAGAAGGIGNVYVRVEGSIWQTEDLADAIREQLLLIKDRNVTTGL